VAAQATIEAAARMSSYTISDEVIQEEIDKV